MNFKSLFMPFIKSGAHAGADILIDNTAGAYVRGTPIKADDYLLEFFVRPEIHKLIDHGFKGFKGINIKDYFNSLKANILDRINDVNTLKSIRDDIDARIRQIEVTKIPEPTLPLV